MNKIVRRASLALVCVCVSAKVRLLMCGAMLTLVASAMPALAQQTSAAQKHRELCSTQGAQSKQAEQACFDYGRDILKVSNPQGITQWCRSNNNGCPK